MCGRESTFPSYKPINTAAPLLLRPVTFAPTLDPVSSYLLDRPVLGQLYLFILDLSYLMRYYIQAIRPATAYGAGRFVFKPPLPEPREGVPQS